jgi:hypothetical protein
MSLANQYPIHCPVRRARKVCSHAECSMCHQCSSMTFTGKGSCYCVFPVCPEHVTCVIACRCQAICPEHVTCVIACRGQAICSELRAIPDPIAKKVTMPVLDTPSFPQVLSAQAPAWTPKRPIVPDGASYLKPA